MKIKKVQLSNGYKRFHDLTIDLGENPKRIIALVGPNGCGKSSVLDGLLFHNNAYGSIGSNGPKDHNYHSMTQTPSFDYQNVIIEFEHGIFSQVRDQKRSTGKENTIFSFRSPYRYNSNLKILESKAVSELRLNSYGATTASDLDEKMNENYRRINIKFNKYLKDNPSTATYDSANAKIIGDLNNSLKECLDLEITSIGNIEDNKGTLFFKKSDHPNEFEFNVLSSGEKEVVDILLDLYLRQEEYNDTVFLIDEPELHINTSIQRKLLLEINKLVGPDCQIWVATHSIGFLRALQEELNNDCQIIQFRQGVNWASESQVLTPIPKTFATWKEIFETALDDLTGLISPKRIIYCEGQPVSATAGGESGLDAIVFNYLFAEEFPETLFISAGGNDVVGNSILAIRILSKAFDGVTLIRLKDRDDKTDVERQAFLDEYPSNRMFKRREIENYLFDKETLRNYAIAKGKVFDEVTYDSHVFDILLQDLKLVQQHIQHSVHTRGSIADFKKELRFYIPKHGPLYNEIKSCL